MRAANRGIAGDRILPSVNGGSPSFGVKTIRTGVMMNFNKLIEVLGMLTIVYPFSPLVATRYTLSIPCGIWLFGASSTILILSSRRCSGRHQAPEVRGGCTSAVPGTKPCGRSRGCPPFRSQRSFHVTTTSAAISMAKIQWWLRITRTDFRVIRSGAGTARRARR